MRAGREHTAAEQERLALYLLGALDDAEREAFEDHLADCWQCLREATELGPSITGMAGLDDEDWSPAFDVPQQSAFTSGSLSEPVALDPKLNPSVGTAKPPPARSRPVVRREEDPSTTRPSTPRGRGSRRRRLAVVAGAFVALVLAGGVVVAVNEWTGHSAPVLTATGVAPDSGASLSVTITSNGKNSETIRITVTGLDAGVRYRLFAVTGDGTTHVVRDWTASAGPQVVVAEAALAVDDLSFISVGQADGTAIVTAPIVRGPTPSH